MADPITIALVAGVVISAAGALTQGFQAASAQRFNAALAIREGEIQQDIAGARAEDIRRGARRRAGAIRAAAGEQGFEAAGGSVADILADEAREAEFAAKLAEFGGELAGFRGEAEARVRAFQGRAAITSGLARAGGTILGGTFRAKQAGFFD
jgi:hypothetical protein